ncbi:MAG: oxidoreductase [Actinomycetota bacterium]|nr:oxidoreductase [Actinomycetota bacterium]MDQ5808604.1 oxidoreductase [Actinomycetota bacterium]
MAESRAVLITGCSTGIGRATAEHLAAKGWPVYATARKVAAVADLEERGCKVLSLDVTDEESMRHAVERVEADHGAVGVLVNNAGYSQSGTIEEVPMEDVRRQFETNVFGLVRLTQLVLPGMRRQHWGKVVNMSSMGANFTFPGGGFYHATKHAVDALTDALRFEVKGFGIDAIIIQPGLIKTNFGDAAVGSMETATSDEGPYAEFNARLAAATKGVYEEGPAAKLGAGPDAVARVIEKAITAKRPKSRYLVTPSAHLLVNQKRLMPDRVWDAFLRTQFPQPK